MVSPTFIPDVSGAYSFSLIVSDGEVASNASQVTVNVGANNVAPIAAAGPNQSVKAGATVTLDGSTSSDANGDTLTYLWSITSKPASSTATLSSTTVVNPMITTDVAGSYVLSLIVNDGKENSVATQLTIVASVANAAPIAKAGTNQNVKVGASVSLDGSGSSDANGDTLSYLWSITSKPASSTATLSSKTVVNPVITTDVAGSYVLSLTVNDGKENSVASQLTIVASVANAAPIAKAGTNQNVKVGASVSLDGSGSSDANGDTLSYLWSITSKPASSTATLSSTTVVNPVITTDVAGSYVLSLTVNDGKESSVASQVIVNSSEPLGVTSTSFANGAVIPIRYTGQGANVSPALSISNVPAGTKFLAVVMDDEVAPCGTGTSACTHWGIFNLPPTKTLIVEGENLLSIAGVVSGIAYNGATGYQGPNPPSNHVYTIAIYALGDSASAVTTSAVITRAHFEAMNSGKILDKIVYTGRFPN